MTKKRKQKLIELGPEVLATALLELAVYSEAAAEVVERLSATPDENYTRIRERLSALQGLEHYYSWREIIDFSRELGLLLQDIRASVPEPTIGLSFVALFFEADASIFEHCDDSSGYVGDVFQEEAKDLFVYYGSQCADKQQVAELILQLSLQDDYGVRNILIDCAGEVLPKPVMYEMIASLQQIVKEQTESHDKRHFLYMIESLARQLKDASLFEKTRTATWGTLSAPAYLDIAEVYLESGDIDTALEWLDKVDEKESMHSSKRDELLLAAYKKQGDSQKTEAMLLKLFRSFRSLDALQDLLDVIGQDKREAVIAKETVEILASDRFQESDAYFLALIGAADTAEEYLLKHADQIDGSYYGELLHIAEALEKTDRPLALSLIYRSLLLSILERGYAKAYSHGVRYLKKLDSLAMQITDWKNIPSHQAVKEQIKERHGRKRSFWSKYQGEV
ncbi:hypothetical protein JWJ90_01565 [Desulfobulbus rhabdoformis]|uniref:tetratricopeptide repeat protein n=1 Tax=Desulfobulbus rhabdoformis TaxID=34032 RepID=UPI00196289A7|nr:DUF6880 family protein [Desulfobulbus rhabdoformis]MBM9612969.1 hypothetical protein [Desulfobulbus rhabdoformis]